MYGVTAEIEATDDGRHVVCSVPLPVATDVVWDAVSTGEGISSWFVPCALEPQVGGRIVQFADPGAPDPTTGPEAAAEAMLTATVGEITVFSPPTGSVPGVFTFEERDWMGEGIPVPPWTTSCEVADDGEGGTVLTLRSGFASGGQLAEESVDGSVSGWYQSLTVLAHRLTHRPADGVVTVHAATDPVESSLPELWSRVLGRLVAPAAGTGAVARSGEVTRSGAVARSGEVGGIVATESEASALIVLSAPVDGVIELYVFPAGDTPEDAKGSAAVAVRAYEYVDAPGTTGAPLGAAAVDGVEPTWDAERWRGWLEALVTG
ncbi:SRPBCC family protein [Dietzia psychralcaliphila]|uniref:SRPBCC family protein n=1 Tax=Dietzia psychralcaliphila TaxID=139021 RepID=UPI001C1E631F|nr:SRPBCC domain-containing protein [Dietzia psychralcaliphila]